MGHVLTSTLVCDRCDHHAKAETAARGWGEFGIFGNPVLLCPSCMDALRRFLRGGAAKAVRK